jgi:RNA polymerase sigma factor (sigma-70 family)
MTIDYDNLWEEYYHRVFGYFFRRLNLRQDVEDLTSVTICAWFEALSKGKVINQHAFLWKIAHNQLCGFINQKSKNPLPISWEDEIANYDQEAEQSRSSYYLGKMQNLSECIQNQLTDQNYQIVYKSILEDKKSYEVATEMGITSDNVRQILSRSIRKLKERCKALW